MALPSASELGGRILQASKFAIVGILNTALDAGIFAFLHFVMAVPYLSANAVSYSVAILNSYVLNKFWTFSDTRRQGRIGRQLSIFVLINLVGLGISSLILFAFAEAAGVLMAKLLAVLATFAWNYFASRKVVFG